MKIMKIKRNRRLLSSTSPFEAESQFLEVVTVKVILKTILKERKKRKFIEQSISKPLLSCLFCYQYIGLKSWHQLHTNFNWTREKKIALNIWQYTTLKDVNGKFINENSLILFNMIYVLTYENGDKLYKYNM